jgi:hypothetical protein
MSAVQSRLDFSQVNAMRIQRRATQPAEAALGVLRRLQHHATIGTLGALTETRIEQSFNEQLFAHVLGYRTLFAGTESPFHLLPKNYPGGRRFDDFSLGFFGIDSPRTLASAEFKAPGCDLDKAQGGNYGPVSPVQQAFGAASLFPECRHVIVSNFNELRLYGIGDQSSWLAVAWLNDIRDSNDVAMLRAHFDRAALIGNNRSPPELLMPQDPNHPSRPLSHDPSGFRLIARFTPRKERELPLFEVEEALRRAIPNSPSWFRLVKPGDLGLRLPINFADGWAAAEGGHPDKGVQVRVAMSLLGQVQVSVGYRWPANQTLELEPMLTGLRFFLGFVGHAHAYDHERSDVEVEGLVTVELRDVAGATLTAGDFSRPRAPALGTSKEKDVRSGDLSWVVEHLPGRMAARAAADLAVYFRSTEGGVGLDVEKLAAFCDERDADDAEGAKLTTA